MNGLKNFDLIVKINHTCNIHCDYCYYLRNTHQIQETAMPLEIITQMIKNIFEYNTNGVRFMWHGGEPLLSGLNVFRAIIREQKRLNTRKLNIHNVIQTNGILLNNDWVDFFAKHKFSVGVSLDGPYNLCKYRNITEINFNKILNGIKLLNSHGVYTGILAVVTRGSVNHARNIFEFFTENEIKRVSFLPCVVVDSVGKVNKTLSIDPESYGKFLSAFLDVWLESDLTDFIFENFDDYIRGRCKITKAFCSQKDGCGKSLTIIPNGDIYLCDNFPQTASNMVGNVRTGFADIPNNPNFKAFMVKIKQFPQKCINCKFFDCCGGGCSHNRWVIDHDFRGDSYLCNGIKLFFEHIEEVIKNTKISL